VVAEVVDDIVVKIKEGQQSDERSRGISGCRLKTKKRLYQDFGNAPKTLAGRLRYRIGFGMTIVVLLTHKKSFNKPFYPDGFFRDISEL